MLHLFEFHFYLFCFSVQVRRVMSLLAILLRCVRVMALLRRAQLIPSTPNNPTSSSTSKLPSAGSVSLISPDVNMSAQCAYNTVREMVAANPDSMAEVFTTSNNCFVLLLYCCYRLFVHLFCIPFKSFTD